MKRYSLQWVVVLAGAAMLNACGGGGDDSGSPTAFSVVPADITVTGGVGTCGAGTVGQVFIYGGQPPYRIDNTVPAYVSINKTQVDHKGESFSVTFLGSCVDPGSIVIVDALDHQVTLTVHSVKGS